MDINQFLFNADYAVTGTTAYSRRSASVEAVQQEYAEANEPPASAWDHLADPAHDDV